MDIEGTLEDRTEAFGGEFQGGSIDIVTSDGAAGNGNGRWKSCAETTSKIEGEAMKTLRQRYPFSAIVGAGGAETGPVAESDLSRHRRGTYPGRKRDRQVHGWRGLWKVRFSRKSTWSMGVPADATPTATRCARGVWSRKLLNPFRVRFVWSTCRCDVPREDRVVGSLDMETALREGRRRFEPGILADANRGILYVDEINLLDDHLVDVLLDAAAMGVNTVEREGVSWSHPSRFVLVGTMNPEEGELSPAASRQVRSVRGGQGHGGTGSAASGDDAPCGL